MVNIIGIILIFYCVLNFIDVKGFVIRIYMTELMLIDMIFILSYIGWTIYQFFNESGVIVLIPFLLWLIPRADMNKRKLKQYHRAIFALMILVTSFVILNNKYFNINLWGKS